MFTSSYCDFRPAPGASFPFHGKNKIGRSGSAWRTKQLEWLCINLVRDFDNNDIFDNRLVSAFEAICHFIVSNLNRPWMDTIQEFDQQIATSVLIELVSLAVQNWGR